METPFRIIHDERIYGFEGEYGKKNYTEYEKFYLINRMRHFLQVNVGRNCLVFYDHERKNGYTQLLIKCKNSEGEISITKYSSAMKKYLDNMKSGRIILYDFSFENNIEEFEIPDEFSGIEDIKIKDNIVYGTMTVSSNFTETLAAFQMEVKKIPKKIDYFFVGNNVKVKYNISRVLKNPIFCDGFLISESSKEDLRLSLSLPEVSVGQILGQKGSFTQIDQFRNDSLVFPINAKGEKIDPPEINTTKVKVKNIFGDPRLIHDAFKYYCGVSVVITPNGNPLTPLEIYETQLMKIRGLLSMNKNYLCRCPLIFLLELPEIETVDGFFFYSSSRNTNQEEDILDNIRKLETFYSWYELESALDITYDLIKELVEVFGGMIVGLFGGKWVITKGIDMSLILKIKMGKFSWNEKIEMPGKVVKKNFESDNYFQVEVDGRILELKKEISQNNWKNGEGVNGWCKYYLSKTGKISCYYLK